MKLSEYAIKKPITTVMVTLSFMVLGGISLFRLPLEYAPDFNWPSMWINIPYPSSSPDEVERFIARPIEEIMGTLSGIKALSSTSYERASRLQSDQGRQLLARRDDLTVMKEQLSLQNGVAFSVTPSSVSLLPFGTCTLSVDVVGNFPGEYLDELVARMDGIDDICVPLHAAILGAPLQFNQNVVGLKLAAPRPPLRPSTGMSQEDFLAAASSYDASPCPLLSFGNLPVNGKS